MFKRIKLKIIYFVYCTFFLSCFVKETFKDEYNEKLIPAYCADHRLASIILNRIVIHNKISCQKHHCSCSTLVYVLFVIYDHVRKKKKATLMLLHRITNYFTGE